ncbi:HAD-like protein [Meredithblackwellia eburnea MCA 4105]
MLPILASRIILRRPAALASAAAGVASQRYLSNGLFTPSSPLLTSSNSTRKPPPPPPSQPAPSITEEPSSPAAAPSPSPPPQPSSASATPAEPAHPSVPTEEIPPSPPSQPAPPTSITKPISLAEEYMEISEVAPPESFGKTTGAKAKGAGTQSTIEKRKHKFFRNMSIFAVVGLVGSAAYLGRDWDDELEKMKLVGRSDDLQAVENSEKTGWEGMYGRGMLRFSDMADYLNKPAWDPLLPPPLPEPHYKHYTLVIDLDDLLVHAVWDRDHGWRTAKRPGLDYFLAYMSLFYEIVLFTTQPAYTAMPIIEKIDPYGAYIPWKLYRESTRNKNNTLIKDLSYLGRPLERTIILDTNPELFSLQPENGVAMQPWKGSVDDANAKELIALIPFLEAIAIKRVTDVRPVIKHYEGKHIPTAYAEAEAKTKAKLVEEWERSKERTSGVVAGILSSALGSLVKPPNRDSPPETDMEQKRKIYQRMYLEEQKYWKDNEEFIKKQMDEDRERQLKEMKNSLVGMFGMKPPENPSSSQPQA